MFIACMNDIQSKLDSIVQKERAKNIKVAVAMSSAVLLFFLLVYGWGIPVRSEVVEGKIVHYGALATSAGGKLYLSVELESGRIIQTACPADVTPKIGSKVKVLKGANILGFVSYRFIAVDKSVVGESVIRQIH